MTIRSIDMQVLVQKVGDVAKIQQVHMQENQGKQQELANQIMEQTVKNRRSVSKTAKNEGRLVNEKQQNDGDKRGRKENKPNKNKESSNDEKKITMKSLRNANKLDIIV